MNFNSLVWYSSLAIGDEKNNYVADFLNRSCDLINEEINEKAKSQDARLFKNLGDNLTFQHSMRNFYSMPNTQIPNNQKDFANFCYGNMPSCKEGDELQCSKNNASFRTT